MPLSLPGIGQRGSKRENKNYPRPTLADTPHRHRISPSPCSIGQKLGCFLLAFHTWERDSPDGSLEKTKKKRREVGNGRRWEEYIDRQ